MLTNSAHMTYAAKHSKCRSLVQTNEKQLQEQEAEETYEQWMPLHTGLREQVSPCRSRTVSRRICGVLSVKASPHSGAQCARSCFANHGITRYPCSPAVRSSPCG
jgi:hypothetical protein